MDVVIPYGSIVYLDSNVVIDLTEGDLSFNASIEHPAHRSLSGLFLRLFILLRP